MKVIKLADFSKYLRCRDENQFDGRYSGKEFRNTYLRELNSPDWWRSVKKINIDFTEVQTISPSWANEAFAFFTRFTSPCMIKNKIIFSNIKELKKLLFN